MLTQVKPIDLIFIASRGHSGSTLLDYLISSHSQVFSAGEVKVLEPNCTQRCSCGAETIWQCAFWMQINEHLQANHQLQLNELQLHSSDPQTFAHHNIAFFDTVRAVTNQPIILDSSKNLARLMQLSQTPNINLHMIKLQRHPCGTVYSNVKKNRSWIHAAYLHRHHQRKAAVFFQNQKHLSVQYEQLAQYPQSELQQIMSFLGLEYEPTQLANLNKLDRHNIGGNRMRFQTPIKIKLDTQWKKHLPFYQKLVICCICR